MKQRLAAFFAIFSLLVAGLVVGGVSETAEAAEARNFDPGNIISDQLFYNDTGMSTAAVQAVLNSRVSACRSGYTCLKDYRQSTPNRAAVSGRCAAYSGGSQSAAEIISRVGAACGISQKVIMIMLEKEQSLITDTWPSARQYRSAMGYGCPDTADCDTNYYGFFNQVYAAALQFKNYQANPTRWNHVPGRYNAVRYNPNAACGSSTVYIQNAATAGLYNYTPYQPNASALANLYGTGDSCGAYGNRNFWRLYTDWFGPTTGSSYGSYDSVSGGYKGITVSGWAMNPNSTAAAYVWVNVDGVGGPFVANTSRSWFNTLYPGYGANHGFDATIAKPPGTYEVCVYNSTMNTLLGCNQVTVPKGAGSFDTASQVPGGMLLTGWAVDYTTKNPTNVTVSVNGKAEPAVAANVSLPWINGYFPGIGANHGYSIKINRPVGTYNVCVDAISGRLGCKTVTLASEEVGAFDTATGSTNSLRLTGWAFDRSSTASTYVWVDVNGKGAAYRANTALSWFEGMFPGAGKNHGYDITIPTTAGSNRVCVYGSATSKLLGCKTVDVPAPAEYGSFDTATAVDGGIKVTGWAYNSATKDPSYVWFDVNGVGTAVKANTTLSWFEGLFPGAGKNHGFDATLPKAAGTYRICAYGSATSVLLGCKTVTVPNAAAPTPAPKPTPTPEPAPVPAPTPTPSAATGSFDTVTPAAGSVRVTGWAYQPGVSPATTAAFVWVDIDGVGAAYRANSTLSWFDGLYPGAGTDHGFDVTIPAAAGARSICVYESSTSTKLGCKTTTVP